MKRVYWTTIILLLLIVTACSSAPAGRIETAAVLPPVASPATPIPTPVPDSTATAGSVVRTDLYGKLLFVRGKDMWVYTPLDGAVRLLLRDTRDARWSPDGKQIAFVRDDGVYIANGDGSDA